MRIWPSYLQAFIDLKSLLKGVFLDIVGGVVEKRLVEGFGEGAGDDGIFETELGEDVLATGGGGGEDDVLCVEGVEPLDVEDLLCDHCVVVWVFVCEGRGEEGVAVVDKFK